MRGDVFAAALRLVGALAFVPCLPLAAIAVFSPALVASAATEATGPLLLGTSLLFVRLVLTVVDAARLGYQEQHITNLWNGLGTAGMAVAIVAAAWLWPTVNGLLLAAQVPLIASRVGNLAGLLKSHPELRSGLVDRSWLGLLLRDNAIHTVVQACQLTTAQLPIVLIDRWASPEGTSTFFILAMFTVTSVGLVTAATAPMIAALQDALHGADSAWIVINVRRAVGGLIGYGAVLAVGGSLLSGFVVSLLFGTDVAPTLGMAVAFGLYAGAVSVENGSYALLVGFGQIKKALAPFAARASVALIALSTLTPRFGAEGAAWAVALAVLPFGAAPLVSLVWRLQRATAEHA